jgi:hypothetical protein
MPAINMITKERLILAVIGFVAGIGGQTTVYLTNPPRVDPFTGKEANAMEQRLQFQIDVQQKQYDKLKIPPPWFKERVDKIENELDRHVNEVHQ